MIIENPFETNNQRKTFNYGEFSPKVSSRFYAFIIDNLCVYQPITYFLTAPLIAFIKKNAFYETGLSTSFYVNLIIISYLFVAILGSTIFTYLYNGTPGQRLFSLQIKSTNQQPVGLWNSFVRAFSFYIQIFVLFLPSLGLLSQKQGVHDKISETQVLSQVGAYFKPVINERTLKLLYSSVFIFVLLSFTNFVFELSFFENNKIKTASESCEPVENLNLHKAVKEWKDEKAPALLYVLTKNQRVSSSCFRDYINEYLSVNSESIEPYYYLWLHEPSSLVKNKYQKIICKETNTYCDLVRQLNSNVPEGNFSELSANEMAQLIHKLNNYEDVLMWDKIIELDSKTAVLNWFPHLRDKIYYLLSTDLKPTKVSSFVSGEYILENTSDQVYSEATTDACFYSLVNSCDHGSKYCSEFMGKAQKKYELNMYDQINLSFMSYCDKGFKPKFRGWDKEKYISLFLKSINDNNYKLLNNILTATYSHVRLKIAALAILDDKKIKVQNKGPILSNFRKNNNSQSADRRPASFKTKSWGEK